MEGLIPVVYKSFKKNRTRQKYECLCSGAAQPYNIEDLHTKDDHDHEHHGYFSRKYEYMMPESDRDPGPRGAHPRRCSSVHVDRLRSFAAEDDAYKPKQIVRFRSQRILSCLTGA